jgi:hypothetical protein
MGTRARPVPLWSFGHGSLQFVAPLEQRSVARREVMNDAIKRSPEMPRGRAPNGSGTQNAPSVASAAGDLIFPQAFHPGPALVNEALSLTKDESLQAAERRYG